MIINQIILVPHVIGLLRFKSKYGSFGKDQYLFEQTTYLAEKDWRSYLFYFVGVS